MDQQAEPAEGGLPLQPCDEVVGEVNPLERRAQHELAGMEDERPVVVDLDELGQILLRLLHVDVGVARVVEDPEVPVDADVHTGRLKQRRVVGLDLDAPLFEKPRDGSIGENHAAIL